MLRNVWVWLLLVGVSPLLVGAQGYAPQAVFEGCPFPAIDGVDCGTLIVPEDRANPAGAQVELAFAIVRAQSATPAPDPIIYLEGGPGGAALLYIEDFLGSVLVQDRDLIVIDQRGTGFSQPSLNCFEMEGDADYLDGLEACYERLLDEGVDLDQYDSVQNAADINDLRIALGYSRVNLWGISYGTRLALTVMRYHPEGIRSVLIDAVFPPEINGSETSAEVSRRALDVFFATCANDPVCDAAYPDLEGRFYDFLDDMLDDPLVFDYFDGEEEYELELYPEDVLDALYLALYDSSVIPILPLGLELLMDAADDIDFTDGYDLISGFYTPATWVNFDEDFPESILDSDPVLDYFDEFGEIDDSEGMYASVSCAEETIFEDVDRAITNAETDILALDDWLFYTAISEFEDCDIWSVEPAEAVENTRVQSDIPTLLMSGELDPITPPSYADSALLGLANGRHIVFPAGSHGESADFACGTSIAAAFFADPAAPLDTSCIAQQVDWYVE